MAVIVGALGTSHAPQSSAPVSQWAGLGRNDATRRQLLGLDGELHSFEEVAAAADPALSAELSEAVWTDKHGRAVRALARLGEILAQGKADALVVVGDDQHELFLDDGIPAIGIFWGEQAVDLPPTAEEWDRLPEALKSAWWSYHGEEPASSPVPVAFGRHLIESLSCEGFDVAQHSRQLPGRSLGHAFTFVRRRVPGADQIPLLPVFLNTYYPPNVPAPARCVALGRALRRAIEAFDAGGAERVVLVASGGLSHHVVDRRFDESLITAMQAGDCTTLAEIERRWFRGGTSESLNWVVVAAAMEPSGMELVDYIPAYRSLAGTGCGLTYGFWPAG